MPTQNTIDTENPQFKNALNLIQFTNQSVFLTGKAGTGKSTFLKYICQTTKKKYMLSVKEETLPLGTIPVSSHTPVKMTRSMTFRKLFREPRVTSM